MPTAINRLVFKLHCFMTQDEGQDLVEYALVVALIAFGATVGMKGLAPLPRRGADQDDMSPCDAGPCTT